MGLNLRAGGRPLTSGVPRPSFAWAGVFLQSQTLPRMPVKTPPMPSHLRRYQQSRDLHFITFSCYRRQPKLGDPSARTVFERAPERTRRRYGLCVLGYVVMPEDVHLLVSEPQNGSLAIALQALKQSVSRTLAYAQANHSGSRATTTATCGRRRQRWRS
jgi:REP element-mobilizing transposase RayT